jgi:hypothetical protein
MRLFSEYFQNNFLHTFVYKIMIGAIESPFEFIKLNLIEESHLFSFLEENYQRGRNKEFGFTGHLN